MLTGNQEKAKAVANFLIEASHNLDPQDYGAMIGSIMGNICGNMSDGYFEKFCKIVPCGRIGCDCHEMHKDLVKLAKKYRRDHEEHCPKGFAV